MTRIEQEERLQLLREQMARTNLSAYLVPKADEYQLEYVPACNDRLSWLSGFTGSAGLAIVGKDRAALFTDSRYTEQAKTQADSPEWEQRTLRGGPTQWLSECLGPDDSVGYNPRVHTPAGLSWLRELSKRVGFSLRAVQLNLVDEIWQGRPAPPCTALEPYPVEIAGESTGDKRRRMALALGQEGLDALVVTDPANLAWLLNVRAGDLPHTPLALGYCLLEQDGSLRTFLASSQWNDQAKAAVSNNTPGSTSFETLEAFEAALLQYSNKRVRLSKGTANEWIVERLKSTGAVVDLAQDPCTLAKACKTPQEIAGIRTAHVRDGAALTRFLHWLASNNLQSETEWSVAAKLDEFRRTGEHYRSLSFRTISAFGPSGASPHYTVTEEGARTLTGSGLYLVDSGGQYLDGTTDVTRVVAVGTPTDEMRNRYTQVLRGHIALSMACFPNGVTGAQLDPLARQFLWASGVDFGHGTGHGVGCYLSVHEGPQGISPRPNSVSLAPGMVVSNEPGYYKPGAYGIRIENLLVVRVAQPQPKGSESTTLEFDTLTLSPYERELIVTEALRPDERRWVDEYHAMVMSSLAPLLPNDTQSWLAKRTQPLT